MAKNHIHRVARPSAGTQQMQPIGRCRRNTTVRLLGLPTSQSKEAKRTVKLQIMRISGATTKASEPRIQQKLVPKPAV